MSERLILLENIHKDYGGKQVLKNINLYVRDKEFVTLLGPSGCGKTTTLRIIGGFETPSAGVVYFDGKKINDVPPHKRQVNTVFQRYALFPHLNVFENIAFGLRIAKLPESTIRERVSEMLKMVNLTGYEKYAVTRLSGGEQQRVAIARALVKQPRILLLDEPLSNLDARLRLQTREELRRIQRETKVTTVFVTHDQEEAMSISDLIVVMRSGIVQQIGRPQAVYDDPSNLFVAKFLGTPPINVFRGQVHGGCLTLEGTAGPVLQTPGAPDKEVWAAVRPEGFVPDPAGPFACGLRRVEVMGRDVSVVGIHPACEALALRAIISAETQPDPEADTVRFALNPRKVLLFDRQTEERVRFVLPQRGGVPAQGGPHHG